MESLPSIDLVMLLDASSHVWLWQDDKIKLAVLLSQVKP
jgi:hypothetical protein